MNMHVTAAVSRAPAAPFELLDLEIEAPREDEILVRIVGAGLCHTDLVAQAGGFPMSRPAVFGHEGAGFVEAIGSAVTKFAIGDRVALTFLSCGGCASCAEHQPAYCGSMPALNYTGKRSDGSKTLRLGDVAVSGSFFGQSSFASHALASERNAVKVPDGVPLELAGILGCGVQTGAGAVMRSMACRAGSSIAVLGGGAVGLSAVMGAVVRGCSSIIVVEPVASRRELAKSLGATHAVDGMAAEDLVRAIRAICPAGVDYVLDTSGIPSVMAAVPGLLASRGTFGFVGLPPANALDTKLPGTLMQAMRGGFTYRGIIEGDSDPDSFLPELMGLYIEGRFPFDRMAKTYPLSQINEAIHDQRQGVCAKVVLIP